MFILYDLIFILFALFYLPVFLFRKKLHPGFVKRFGVLPKDQRFTKPFWIHAVSVGEAASIRHLVEELRADFPGRKFVFSTVTPTGNTIVSSIAGKGDFVTYLPLDHSYIVRKTFQRIDPAALIIVETELWPNLIYWASRKGIPVIVVNGRISDASFRRYRLVRFLLKPLLNKITVFCVQSERDASKLSALGLDAKKIRVTGNMKFDIKVKDYDGLKKDYIDYRKSAGIGSGDKLWVAASTHQGEEPLVMQAYIEARKKLPRLRLLVAPRHPERATEVEGVIAQAGLKPVRISAIASAKGGLHDPAGSEVFILDTVGKLMYFYAIADIVFVGGSLVKKGGHNILEPASLGKPVLFGPAMFNFRDIAALFLQGNAAVQVEDGKGLEEGVAALLADFHRASALGAAARKIIEDNKGATKRNEQVIHSIISGTAV